MDSHPKTKENDMLENPQEPSEPVVTELLDDTDADKELVEIAVQEIKNLVSKNFANAMMEVGQYLIKEFFDDDLELAKQKKSKKESSFFKVITKLKVPGERNPSKSWLYNAINLVVDSAALADFHSFGKLPLSSKLLLSGVKDEDRKKELADIACNENLSASQLRERINESKKGNETSLQRFLRNKKSIHECNTTDILTKFGIDTLPDKKIEKAKVTIDQQIKELNELIKIHSDTLSKYEQIKSGLGKPQKKIKSKS